MKKILCILFSLTCGMCGFCATHIHTDAADYRAGDRMWFRVYFLDENQYPDTVVSMALVELINPEGMISKRVKIPRTDDIFSGYIDIPSYAEGGQYLVRAYARGRHSPSYPLGEQIVYIHGRVSSEDHKDSVVCAIKNMDNIVLNRVPMPLSVHALNKRQAIALDTSYLQPGERVFVSASITDRYALSRHPQWTILQSVAYPSNDSLALHTDEETVVQGVIAVPVRRKPIRGAIVNMIIPEIYQFATDTADEYGKFAFADELVPEGMNVLLMAYRPDGRQDVILEIKEESFPGYESTPPAWLRVTMEKPVSLIELSDIADSVLLEEIEVTAERRIQESAVETQTRNIADMSFGLNKIEEYSATCLHDLLRCVPGVHVVNDQCFIRGAHSIYAKNPAAIAINGVIQEGDYDLDIIPMQDIARLDIFKTGKTAIWGARGGSGVISIILKDGSEVPQQSAAPSNMRRLKPLGWQLPATFFVQTPADGTRRPGTIWWDPNVQTPFLPFFPQATTIYDVVVEGVTSHGRLVHEKYEIMNTL